MSKTSTQRLVTSVIGAPAILAVVLFAPPEIAFVVYLGLCIWSTIEFRGLARWFAPSAPLKSLLLLVPLTSLAGFYAIWSDLATDQLGLWLMLSTGLLALAAACTVLLAGGEVRDGLVGIGILAFAIPYFGTPAVLFYHLQRLDPWLVFALLVMVWLGDSTAYYVGSSIGRRKLAPVVSPNKTWEGAAASLLASLAVATIWGLARLGEVPLGWLLVAAVTSVAAQLGDLVESLIKRGAGVKDSASILPGHGGFYDRLDALFLATPAYAAGVWILGLESLIPRSI